MGDWGLLISRMRDLSTTSNNEAGSTDFREKIETLLAILLGAHLCTVFPRPACARDSALVRIS